MDAQLQEIFDKNHMYMTDERRRFFDYLASLESPASIQQIANDLDSKMNESTVYRNVRTFEQLGIINRVYSGWKYKIELSDAFSHHHHHLSCTGCDKIISFEESQQFIDELDQLEKRYDFKISSHSLELKGLCKSCST